MESPATQRLRWALCALSLICAIATIPFIATEKSPPTFHLVAMAVGLGMVAGSIPILREGYRNPPLLFARWATAAAYTAGFGMILVAVFNYGTALSDSLIVAAIGVALIVAQHFWLRHIERQLRGVHAHCR